MDFIFFLLETIEPNIGWWCFILNHDKFTSSGLIINRLFPLLQQLLILTILRNFKVKVLLLEYVIFSYLNTVADQCIDIIVDSRSHLGVNNEAKCGGRFFVIIIRVNNVSLAVVFSAAHL